MVDAFLETRVHPNDIFEMVDIVLKIIMLETIVHSNGKCTLGNNNVGNNSPCLDMTHI
jgi:hypothetical protein